MDVWRGRTLKNVLEKRLLFRFSWMFYFAKENRNDYGIVHLCVIERIKFYIDAHTNF